jgi:predicted O-methyltransferase YrrM
MKCETNLLQDLGEFTDFLKLIREEKVGSYLEIGSKHGGSLWRVANELPKGSRIVSVDLPHGDGSFKDSEPNLKQCVNVLINRGYDAYLFLADSTDALTVEAVRRLAPFDLCFIDGYHTEEFVRADWMNYGPMARLVASTILTGGLMGEPPRRLTLMRRRSGARSSQSSVIGSSSASRAITASVSYGDTEAQVRDAHCPG